MLAILAQVIACRRVVSECVAAFAPGREGSTLAAGGHCKNKKNEKMYGHSRSVGQTLVINCSIESSDFEWAITNTHRDFRVGF